IQPSAHCCAMMAGLPEKFQVVKRHNIAFSLILRVITAHQRFNVGTLLVSGLIKIGYLGIFLSINRDKRIKTPASLGS
ncbi:MAG TPA: hypothetical protein VI298_06005, partial [Geobacteraceae bacterium]